jgi:FkbM family methyltransferase
MLSSLWKDIEGMAAKLSDEAQMARQALSGNVAVFGSGQHGAAALKYLQARGVRVRCLADNNPAIHGRAKYGMMVCAPSELQTAAPDIVFVATRHAVLPVCRQLCGMGLPSISFDAFYVVEHLEGLRNLRDCLLGDPESRRVLDGILMSMLTGREKFCAEVMEPTHYFCLPQFVNLGTDHFIDAGAYVGDTTEKFIWSNNGAFASVHAFEPGITQFKALKSRVARLIDEWALPESKIKCVPAGLGAANGALGLSSDPENLIGATFFTFPSPAGAERVAVYSLDDYLNGAPATFIKADVEGMEMDLLKGAARTIAGLKPKLAISIYHENDHLFSIAEYIKALAPDYRMAIRHHSPLLMDTVLYCWIDG